VWNKAGSDELSESDTLDAVGQYPAVLGMDTLSLVGDELTADFYNEHLAKGNPPVDIGMHGEAYAHVVAAARMANDMIQQGCIVSLSAHMPNFSIVKEKAAVFGDKTYAKYDYNGYSPNVLEGNVIPGILPGGPYHEKYTAYLDMVADFASLVDGALMFRPFHEGTGSWFWWGEEHCTPEQFIETYRFTVDYLKKTKGIHNLLYVYSPGSEPKSPEEYGVRYPGDDYVDMVGFDMYDRMLDEGKDEQFFADYRRQLSIVETFADKHHKLMAVTETGITAPLDEGDTGTALHRSGNKNPNWYMDVLNATAQTKASYFLLWANFGNTAVFIHRL
jgi:mannan endo-1,4-beta-mannosidase